MRTAFRAIAGAVLALGLAATSPSAQTLRAHGPEPGGGSYIATVAIGRMAERAGYGFQLQAGQTGTRSLVELARGEIDLTLLPVPAVEFFRSGRAMYAQMADAPQLYHNLRGMLVWECCLWHFVTYADSGIRTMEDLRGRRVFTGPPGSVAKANLESIIAAATGMQAGTDYTAINIDWGEGAQALRDGNIDVLIQSGQLGSPTVEQLSVNSGIWLISLPPIEGNEALRQATMIPGNQISTIPPGTYVGQANTEPVSAIAIRHIAGVGVHTDPDVVYNITRTLWENIAEFHGYGDFLRAVNPEMALLDMNVPLHAGAYRYYREIGWEIPQHLVPPDAN